MRKQDTEARILDAATKLFGELGYDGVSLREILKLADANIASAHYYFGSKQELFIAVSARFASRIAEERLQNLSAVEESTGFVKSAVDDLLRGYVQPHYNVASEPTGEDYLRVFSRFQAESKQYSMEFFEGYFGDSRARYISALGQALAPIDQETLARGFSLFVTSMLVAPFDYGFTHLSGEDPADTDYQELLETVVTFSSAGLKALADGR